MLGQNKSGMVPACSSSLLLGSGNRYSPGGTNRESKVTDLRRPRHLLDSGPKLQNNQPPMAVFHNFRVMGTSQTDFMGFVPWDSSRRLKSKQSYIENKVSEEKRDQLGLVAHAFNFST